MTEPEHPVERFSARVQAAQKEFSDTMADYWRQVVKGELSEAEYWAIGWDGVPVQKCRAEIQAATAEYKAHRYGS